MSSRYWRSLVTNFVLGIALDYAICIALAAAFFGRDYLLNGFFLLLGLWALQIVLAFKNLIVSVTQYYLFLKKRLVRRGEMILHAKVFPFDDDILLAMDSVEYMARVARNPKSTPEQIAIAANFLGEVETLKRLQISGAWQMMSAMDVALDNYMHRIATQHPRESDESNALVCK